MCRVEILLPRPSLGKNQMKAHQSPDPASSRGVPNEALPTEAVAPRWESNKDLKLVLAYFFRFRSAVYSSLVSFPSASLSFAVKVFAARSASFFAAREAFHSSLVTS